uniref:Uncharacterized protein n=1 Tax=Aegilops tauschii subsp. strangulata TaxID=200361 RepID=A0A453IJW3_AEGTS
MDAAEETRLLLQEDGDQDASLYTGDGSVDIKGRPATRRDTGNWRACVFILGNIYTGVFIHGSDRLIQFG